MKINSSLLLLCLIAVASCVTAARRTSSSGRSRGSNRGSGTRGNTKAPAGSSSSHDSLASLSYSGYGQSAAKPKPKPSAPQESRPVGWDVGGRDTTVRKNVGASNQAPSHSYPAGGSSGTSNQQNHGYPSNTGTNVQQSHAYPVGSNPNQQNHAYPAAGSAGSNVHAYPSSGGLSGGANQAASYPGYRAGSNQQQGHAYPSSGGLSGNGAGAPPGYPAQPGAVPHYTQSGYPAHGNPAYPAGNQHGGYPVGGNPSYTGGFPNNGQQNYPGYSQPGMPYGGVGGYGGMGGMGYGGYGNNGGYGSKYGGVSRGPSVLTGLGIAGAGVGTILTGLALYNLARGGNTRHIHHYEKDGSAVNAAAPEKLDSATEAMLANMLNCSLTIQNNNNTEIVAIPCIIATSFGPNSDAKKDPNFGNLGDANITCTIAVTNKDGSEYRTSIPCATLANLGANATNSGPPNGPGQPPVPFDANHPPIPNGNPPNGTQVQDVNQTMVPFNGYYPQYGPQYGPYGQYGPMPPFPPNGSDSMVPFNPYYPYGPYGQMQPSYYPPSAYYPPMQPGPIQTAPLQPIPSEGNATVVCNNGQIGNPDPKCLSAAAGQDELSVIPLASSDPLPAGPTAAAAA